MESQDGKKKTDARRVADSTVTAKDIAALTGVSTTTVSSILSGRNVVRVAEATRQLVLSTAQEKGYRRNQLATALRTGRTNTIGIVSPLTWSGVEDIRHTYLTKLLTAISVAGSRAGMNAMTFIDSPFHDLRPDKVADGRVEGVVLFGLPTHIEGSGDWVRELEAMGLPLVEIGSRHSHYQVHADNFGGAGLAAKHLIELGHRRIGYFQSTDQRVSIKNRLDGFMTVLREAGIPPEHTPVVEGGDEFQALLRSPQRPTAFFCSTDRMALLAYNYLREAGLRVPEEISVVGFDNSIVSEVVWPPLTSVDNPLTAMAEAAISLLVSQLEKREIPSPQLMIETHLEVRGSTAPPRNHQSKSMREERDMNRS
ncbi:HTH-type transcriptional repressor CytR [Abditibacteriota bacterium]|nr:HTH-type transcriptional repressor CytR [Abditibacteriota bacterium]